MAIVGRIRDDQRVLLVALDAAWLALAEVRRLYAEGDSGELVEDALATAVEAALALTTIYKRSQQDGAGAMDWS